MEKSKDEKATGGQAVAKPSDAQNEDFFLEIRQIIDSARSRAYSAVNTAMVEAYWQIGRRIVEEEQHGEDRAAYGQSLIKELSKRLVQEYGNGFSVVNLKNMRFFYLTFRSTLNVDVSESSRKGHTVCAQFQTDNPSPHPYSERSPKGHAVRTLFQTNSQEPNPPLSEQSEKGYAVCSLLDETPQIPCLGRLSWSHYRVIMRVDSEPARLWYLREAAENQWSVRTLDRNISTQYYERLLMSQKKEPVVQEMREKTIDYQRDKFEFIKSPAVLEFLNLPNNLGFTESDLEKALIDNLQQFILELGKGYAFVERQKLMRTEARNYYVDLVFYNYILKCFVLIDLKTERITHQDVGQMDMYVRMFDETICSEGDNPTLGIVLCSETDQDIARYSILKGNEQIFAAKYKLYLPSEEELAREIERQKSLLKTQLEKE